MSDDTPDKQDKSLPERLSARSGTPARSADQPWLGRSPSTSAGKAGAGSKRALRLARNGLSSRSNGMLKSALRAAAKSGRKAGQRRSPNIRGAGVRGVGRHAQRVVVKTRVVPLKGKSPYDVMRNQLAYLERDGVDRDGERGQLFNGDGNLDREAVAAFVERGVTCRHQFRFIVSPERGGDLDLTSFTRDLVGRMEHDLGSALDYVACVHYDTDQPHVHMVVNGRDDRGGDLVISRDYIASGLRHRAAERVTNELGYRSDLEVLQSLDRDVRADRFTALDRRLQTLAERDSNGRIDMRRTPVDARAAQQRRLLLGRLAHLEGMDLASEVTRGIWRLEPDALDRLRGLTQHREVQHQVERHVHAQDRAGSVVVVDKATLKVPVTGQVLGRGLANELTGTVYLVVSGTDGKTYYAALSPHAERHLDRGTRAGDIVTLRRVERQASGHADRNVVAFAKRNEGFYDPKLHEESLGDARLPHDATPERYVEAHVARLEALVSRGVVTREPNGRYRIPPDLIERIDHEGSVGRDNAFVRVDVRGRDLRSQSTVRAYTWLDEQLIAGVPRQLRQSPVRTRFQEELIAAADRRVAQLVTLELAVQETNAVRLDPALRTKLDALERSDATVRLSTQYGSAVKLDAVRRFDGRVAAIETLASGPHAVVVAGDRFALVSAERGLARHLGKDVSLMLDRAQRDANQTRIRYRVVDSLDLSPALGR